MDSGLKAGEGSGTWSLKGWSAQRGGPGERLLGPFLPLCGLPALGSPQDFSFCSMLQTILAQLLSDVGPSFGIWFWCPQSLPSDPTLDYILGCASP